MNLAGQSASRAAHVLLSILRDAGAMLVQCFVSLHAAVYNIFNVQRHLIRRATLRRFRAEAHQAWNGATAAA